MPRKINDGATKPKHQVVAVGVKMPARRQRQPKAPAAAPSEPKGQAEGPQQAQGLASTAAERRALPSFAQHDPEKLTGEALRDLAHERGMSRSEVAAMADFKVREQLRYITASNFGR